MDLQWVFGTIGLGLFLILLTYGAVSSLREPRPHDSDRWRRPR